MKVTDIKVEHIGPHANTQMDLQDKPSIIAITGSNGAGKTFLLEAVPACLYGVFPTRPGSIYDRITNGFEGKAILALEFEMSGQRYIAKRILKRKGKTTTSEASLFINKQPDSLIAPSLQDIAPIAGPKVKDFEAAIVNLLGTQDTFLASVFSSQRNTGDICDSRPAERKAVFAKLLGLERFDQVSMAAKDKARMLEQDISNEESAILGLKAHASGLEEAMAELIKSEEDHKQAIYNIDAKKIEVENLEARVKEGAVAVERWKSLDAQAKDLAREIPELEAEISTDREEYKRLQVVIVRGPAILQAEHSLEKALQDKDDLQAELRKIERENATRKSEHEKRTSQINLASAEIASTEQLIARLEEQASLLDKTPNQECCTKCVLVSSAVNAKKDIASLKPKLLMVRATLAQMGDNLPRLDLLDDKVIGARLLAKQGEISQLKSLTADSAKLREAQGSIKTLVEVGKSKGKALAGKFLKRTKAEAEAAEALKLCPDKDLTAWHLQAKMDLGNFESRVSAITSARGSLKERVARMAESAGKAKTAEKGIAETKERAGDLREIEKAFGRSGIQPLIIEQARPELETISDEMLAAATEGRMRVRFETQKELKSGDTVESLDIIVSKDGHDLDIGELSGGEQKIIRTAIRLTLSVWQARKGGSRLKTLFIDEIFDSLDKENSGRVIRLLGSLQGQFDRIILISHDDDLLEDVPVMINVKGGKI